MSMNRWSRPASSKYDLDMFGAVYERDVDLVLALALRASPRVRSLVLASIGVEEIGASRVQHSVATGDGREADIVLTLDSRKGAVVVEIENKLSASFQSGQAQSYAARARIRRDGPDYLAGYSVLVAPSDYLQSHLVERDEFDASLAYESVHRELLADGPWGSACGLVLEHAVAQHRRGRGLRESSPERTRFFAEFAHLAEDFGLPAVPRISRQPGAGFLWYRREGCLEQVPGWALANGSHGAWLVAKFTAGTADIELTGLLEFADVERLGNGFADVGSLSFESRGASARMRRECPVLDPDAPLDSQLDAAREFMEQLSWLHRWWHESGRELVRRCLHQR